MIEELTAIEALLADLKLRFASADEVAQGTLWLDIRLAEIDRRAALESALTQHQEQLDKLTQRIMLAEQLLNVWKAQRVALSIQLSVELDRLEVIDDEIKALRRRE